MRKMTWLIWVLLAVWCTAAQAEGQLKQVVSETDWIYMYTQVDPEAMPIGPIPNGALLQAEEPEQNGFELCLYNGVTGYVQADALHTVADPQQGLLSYDEMLGSTGFDIGWTGMPLRCRQFDDDSVLIQCFSEDKTPVWQYRACGGVQQQATALHGEEHLVLVLNDIQEEMNEKSVYAPGEDAMQMLTALDWQTGKPVWTLSREELGLAEEEVVEYFEGTMDVCYLKGENQSGPICISEDGEILWRGEYDGGGRVWDIYLDKGGHRAYYEDEDGDKIVLFPVQAKEFEVIWPLETKYHHVLVLRGSYEGETIRNVDYYGDEDSAMVIEAADADVMATADGVVVETGWKENDIGLYVKVRHTAYTEEGCPRYLYSLYGGLAKTDLVPGVEVRQGEIIGVTAETLHFEAFWSDIADQDSRDADTYDLYAYMDLSYAEDTARMHIDQMEADWLSWHFTQYLPVYKEDGKYIPSEPSGKWEAVCPSVYAEPPRHEGQAIQGILVE